MMMAGRQTDYFCVSYFFRLTNTTITGPCSENKPRRMECLRKCMRNTPPAHAFFYIIIIETVIKSSLLFAHVRKKLYLCGPKL